MQPATARRSPALAGPPLFGRTGLHLSRRNCPMSIVGKPAPGSTLLTPKDHVLVMIDYQSQMAFATKSIDPVVLRANAGLISKAAAGFKVPTVLTTVAEKTFSGPMFSEVTEPFPGQKLIDRTSMNTWEDA